MSVAMNWDIFESESLSVRRAQSEPSVKAALANGSLTLDDLARPAGTANPWRRLGDLVPEWPDTPVDAPAAKALKMHDGQRPATVEEDLELVDPGIEIDMDSSSNLEIHPPARTSSAPPPTGPAKAVSATSEMQAMQWLTSNSEESGQAAVIAETPVSPELRPAKAPSPRAERWLEPSVMLEPLDHDGPELMGGVVAEADDDDEFTLSRSSVEKVEELDLAAMVDVAFQLVLFFMVTASVTLIKSMELPKPLESTKPAAASAPGVGTRNKEEVESDFIVVAIAADGEIRVEDEPTISDQLVERLREARTQTGKTGMILRADNKTKHRAAVAAYDAANAIGLKIAIERDVTP